MATSAVAVVDGAFTKTYNILATNDADTTLDIVHGLGAAPDWCALTPLAAPGIASEWSADWTTAATTCTLTKNSTIMGTGDAAAQIFCTLQVLHSIIR